MKEIEDFLRENRPITKDDPTFILETQRRMEQVEGIKGEVDRQRRHGRVALILALAAGLALVYYGSRKVLKKGISPIGLIGVSALVGILVYGF